MEKLLLETEANLHHWQTTQVANKGQYAIDRIQSVKADSYPAVLVWTWQEVPHNSSDWLEWEMVYPSDFPTPA